MKRRLWLLRSNRGVHLEQYAVLLSLASALAITSQFYIPRRLSASIIGTTKGMLGDTRSLAGGSVTTGAGFGNSRSRAAYNDGVLKEGDSGSSWSTGSGFIHVTPGHEQPYVSLGDARERAEAIADHEGLEIEAFVYDQKTGRATVVLDEKDPQVNAQLLRRLHYEDRIAIESAQIAANDSDYTAAFLGQANYFIPLELVRFSQSLPDQLNAGTSLLMGRGYSEFGSSYVTRTINNSRRGAYILDSLISPLLERPQGLDGENAAVRTRAISSWNAALTRANNMSLGSIGRAIGYIQQGQLLSLQMQSAFRSVNAGNFLNTFGSPIRPYYGGKYWLANDQAIKFIQAEAKREVSKGRRKIAEARAEKMLAEAFAGAQATEGAYRDLMQDERGSALALSADDVSGFLSETQVLFEDAANFQGLFERAQLRDVAVALADMDEISIQDAAWRAAQVGDGAVWHTTAETTEQAVSALETVASSINDPSEVAAGQEAQRKLSLYQAGVEDRKDDLAGGQQGGEAALAALMETGGVEGSVFFVTSQDLRDFGDLAADLGFMDDLLTGQQLLSDMQTLNLAYTGMVYESRRNAATDVDINLSAAKSAQVWLYQQYGEISDRKAEQLAGQASAIQQGEAQAAQEALARGTSGAPNIVEAARAAGLIGSGSSALLSANQDLRGAFKERISEGDYTDLMAGDEVFSRFQAVDVAYKAMDNDRRLTPLDTAELGQQAGMNAHHDDYVNLASLESKNGDGPGRGTRLDRYRTEVLNYRTEVLNNNAQKSAALETAAADDAKSAGLSATGSILSEASALRLSSGGLLLNAQGTQESRSAVGQYFSAFEDNYSGFLRGGELLMRAEATATEFDSLTTEIALIQLDTVQLGNMAKQNATNFDATYVHPYSSIVSGSFHTTAYGETARADSAREAALPAINNLQAGGDALRQASGGIALNAQGTEASIGAVEAYFGTLQDNYTGLMRGSELLMRVDAVESEHQSYQTDKALKYLDTKQFGSLAGTITGSAESETAAADSARDAARLANENVQWAGNELRMAGGGFALDAQGTESSIAAISTYRDTLQDNRTGLMRGVELLMRADGVEALYASADVGGKLGKIDDMRLADLGYQAGVNANSDAFVTAHTPLPRDERDDRALMLNAVLQKVEQSAAAETAAALNARTAGQTAVNNIKAGGESLAASGGGLLLNAQGTEASIGAVESYFGTLNENIAGLDRGDELLLRVDAVETEFFSVTSEIALKNMDTVDLGAMAAANAANYRPNHVNGQSDFENDRAYYTLLGMEGQITAEPVVAQNETAAADSARAAGLAVVDRIQAGGSALRQSSGGLALNALGTESSKSAINSYLGNLQENMTGLKRGGELLMRAEGVESEYAAVQLAGKVKRVDMEVVGGQAGALLAGTPGQPDVTARVVEMAPQSLAGAVAAEQLARQELTPEFAAAEEDAGNDARGAVLTAVRNVQDAGYQMRAVSGGLSLNAQGNDSSMGAARTFLGVLNDSGNQAGLIRGEDLLARVKATGQSYQALQEQNDLYALGTSGVQTAAERAGHVYMANHGDKINSPAEADSTLALVTLGESAAGNQALTQAIVASEAVLDDANVLRSASGGLMLNAQGTEQSFNAVGAFQSSYAANVSGLAQGQDLFTRIGVVDQAYNAVQEQHALSGLGVEGVEAAAYRAAVVGNHHLITAMEGANDEQTQSALESQLQGYAASENQIGQNSLQNGLAASTNVVAGAETLRQGSGGLMLNAAGTSQSSAEVADFSATVQDNREGLVSGNNLLGAVNAVNDSYQALGMQNSLAAMANAPNNGSIDARIYTGLIGTNTVLTAADRLRYQSDGAMLGANGEGLSAFGATLQDATLQSDFRSGQNAVADYSLNRIAAGQQALAGLGFTVDPSSRRFVLDTANGTGDMQASIGNAQAYLQSTADWIRSNPDSFAANCPGCDAGSTLATLQAGIAQLETTKSGMGSAGDPEYWADGIASSDVIQSALSVSGQVQAHQGLPGAAAGGN